jgi:hypothetical protein
MKSTKELLQVDISEIHTHKEREKSETLYLVTTDNNLSQENTMVRVCSPLPFRIDLFDSVPASPFPLLSINSH